MANRKQEVNEAQKKGESIVANRFADNASKSTGASVEDTKADMYSMDYEDAKAKYGTRNGNNTYFMSKEQFDRQKTLSTPEVSTEVPTEVPEEKTWQSRVKEGTATDADMEKAYEEYKAGRYTPGPKTKKYFDTSFNPSTPVEDIDNNDVIDGIEKISNEVPEVEKVVESIQDEDGSINKEKVDGYRQQFEAQMVKDGFGSFDKEGNFSFNKVKSGWETWATIASCVVSAVGLSMGVPIYPINFRSITNKDAKDAQLMELQSYYSKLLGNAANTEIQKEAEAVGAANAGRVINANEEDVSRSEQHDEKVGAYKAKTDINTEASKELIGAQTRADMKKAQQQIEANESLSVKLLQLEQKHAKEMASLSSELSTNSAIALTKYSKTGWVVDYIKTCKEEGMTNRDIALAMAGLNGVTPTQMGLKNAESLVDMVNTTANTATDIGATIATGGLNKVAKK